MQTICLMIGAQQHIGIRLCPSKPFGIQSVEESVNSPLNWAMVSIAKRKTLNENDEMKAAHKSMSDRGDIFYPAQKAVHERYQEITRNYSRGNIEYGKDLREKVGK